MQVGTILSCASFEKLSTVDMSQQCLNNLMVLHVHDDVTDSLGLKQAAQRFMKNHGCRIACLVAFC